MIGLITLHGLAEGICQFLQKISFYEKDGSSKRFPMSAASTSRWTKEGYFRLGFGN